MIVSFSQCSGDETFFAGSSGKLHARGVLVVIRLIYGSVRAYGYFSNILKTYILSNFSAGGLHDLGMLLLISLEFQEIKHHPFSMT